MEDLVFDEMIGRWVSPKEYEEFIEAMLEEDKKQEQLKEGIDSDLAYPTYNLRVIQDIMKERNTG